MPIDDFPTFKIWTGPIFGLSLYFILSFSELIFTQSMNAYLIASERTTVINWIFAINLYGGVDTRSGYVRYVPVISADVPCTYYIHRDI